ncbi:hypothetical protein [Methylobacterium sp. ARG-1]|uniref:hypothetical protein n=1 Tax=Methylobacterium sp. ARG-1 TaxID=1692501 RepID=UPI000A9097DB
MGTLKVDQSVRPVRRFKGGATQAEATLNHYLGARFNHYATVRGRPEAGAASHMSPYLHYGQISPVAIALRVRAAATCGEDDKAAYLEELIVRRELAMNHNFYEPNYDSYEAAPAWTRRTVDAHRRDPRPYLYTPEQFERSETHDRYWNAAMMEMRETGYMHNHMRMYWGKKIVEWSASPEEALETALILNNKFFIDGRDANSFTNVIGKRSFGREPDVGRSWLPRRRAQARVSDVGGAS